MENLALIVSLQSHMILTADMYCISSHIPNQLVILDILSGPAKLKQNMPNQWKVPLLVAMYCMNLPPRHTLSFNAKDSGTVGCPIFSIVYKVLVISSQHLLIKILDIIKVRSENMYLKKIRFQLSLCIKKKENLFPQNLSFKN